MMATITLEFDVDGLSGYTDEYLAALWQAAQAQNKPFGDKEACETTEKIGREIIRRFVTATPPALYHFQGQDVARARLFASKAQSAPSKFKNHQSDDGLTKGSHVDGSLIVFLDDEYRKEGWRSMIPADLPHVHRVMGWRSGQDIIANGLHFTQEEEFRDAKTYRVPFSATCVDVTSLRNLVSGWRYQPPVTLQPGHKSQSRDPE
ncbi:hypothetical protein J2X56_001620 [Herbaspirillum sp. 1173]|uniref:hypothetical protein n=1 Tax=Herbaspirillum sp. 1173 TaxID=2817734 RepID=UPI002856FF92|nr:hypothetical protein [Herbaspirillum sp. 1173]MDR6739606.1 hypothetical protein [Herbaspirillum sp. 1173]